MRPKPRFLKRHSLFPKVALLLWLFVSGGLLAAVVHFDAIDAGVDKTDRTFDVDVNPYLPIVVTGSVAATNTISPSVSGQVNAKGFPTLMWVEWGPTTNYGRVTAPASAGFEDILQVRTNILTDIRGGVAYHARLIASNFFGISFGADVSFALPTFLYTGQIMPGGFTGSAAWGDYDNDRRLDLVAASYVSFDPPAIGTGHLFQNGGNDMFTDINASLPAASIGTSMVAWGDYDNDGFLDLLMVAATNTVTGRAETQLYQNKGDGRFTLVDAGLPDILNGRGVWGDFDNDGRLDILLCGVNTSNLLTRIYRNNGDGTFSDIQANLPGVSYGSAAWGDFDNDGWLDLALAGATNEPSSGVLGVGINRVYRNNGDGTFSDINAGLPGNLFGSVAWGDFDGDGWLDLAVFGEIYRNNHDRTFTLATSGLPSRNFGSVAWGDFNNDGRPDLLLSGTANSQPVTRIFRNDGTNVAGGWIFTDINAGLPGPFSQGLAAWGDYNGDGTLDVLIAGQGRTYVYRNDTLITNTPPGAPTGLTFAMKGSNSVTLHWHSASDAQTPGPGLTYNFVISTRSNLLNAPMADLTDGFRRVAQMGNANHNTNWTFSGLPPAPAYYWAVQAVDSALAGGAWSEVSMITPVLTVTLPAPGSISLAWPSFWPGYTLEQNTDLPNQAGWSSVLPAPVDDWTNKSVLLIRESTPRFFRLRH